MDFIPTIFVVYLLVLTLLLGPVAWAFRERAVWSSLELVGPIGAFTVWGCSLFMGRHPKSMGNLLVEPAVLGIAVAVAGWLRVALAPALGPSRAGGLCMLFALASGWLVWLA